MHETKSALASSTRRVSMGLVLFVGSAIVALILPMSADPVALAVHEGDVRSAQDSAGRPQLLGSDERDPRITASGFVSLWGDIHCDGSIDAVDALRLLGYIAKLPSTPECGPGGGPTPGAVVEWDEGDLVWGDLDCDGDIDAVDALWILRAVVALPVPPFTSCPEIGAAIEI